MMHPEQATHHVANAAAVVAPVAAWLAQAPFFISLLTGLLGALWYCILIGKEIAAWRKKRDVR